VLAGVLGVTVVLGVGVLTPGVVVLVGETDVVVGFGVGDFTPGLVLVGVNTTEPMAAVPPVTKNSYSLFG
jgi:hypothetical protein